MKNTKRLKISALLILCLVLVMACTVSAAPKPRNKWVKSKGRFYHYNDAGKKDTGLIKVGKRTFYFDKKGVQRTGWKCIDGEYYFFRIMDGRGGYMSKSKTVNGITLTKSGKAKYNRSGLRKLKIMVRANEIMEDLVNCDMTKTQKLRKCYDKALTYRCSNAPWGGFRHIPDWDMLYAEEMLGKERGDCYSFGAVFAYFANAIGMKKAYVISSGGHGWAEVQGKVYDPNWALATGKKDTYFCLDYSLSGVGGRPNYKRNRVYVKRI